MRSCQAQQQVEQRVAELRAESTRWTRQLRDDDVELRRLAAEVGQLATDRRESGGGQEGLAHGGGEGAQRNPAALVFQPLVE